jgi:hypothetical protein
MQLFVGLLFIHLAKLNLLRRKKRKAYKMSKELEIAF